LESPKLKKTIPDHLKELAVGLLKQHPAKILSETLDVSLSSLNRWRLEENKKPHKDKNKSPFIKLPISEEHQNILISSSSGTNNNTCTLGLPNGIQINVPITSSEQATNLVYILLKEYE